MDRMGELTKALATVGTALAWFPIAATVLTGAVGSIARGRLLLDYLMPAELFPIAFLGGALLWWAALRAHRLHKPIGWGLAAMLGLLAGGQAFAILTGLASGETAPAGWQWIVTLASIVGYTLALVEVGCAGALLLRDLFKHGERHGSATEPGV